MAHTYRHSHHHDHHHGLESERTASPDVVSASDAQEINRIIGKLTIVGVGGNALLVVFKLVAGLLGNSMAMVSDAVHSLSDVLATLIAFVGSKLANKEADSDHPYGHERFECLAALVLALILLGVGIGIGYAGVDALVSGSWREANPTVLALVGALVSIACKEAMFQYTMHYAKAIGSVAFKADAWHHRSDALSSVGAAAGIVAAMCGVLWADAVASILICLVILKIAFDVGKEAIENMTDTSCSEEEQQAITNTILSVEGVQGLHLLRTRKFGSRVYVEVEIICDGCLSLVDAHDIAETVHNRVEQDHPTVKHVMVHVDPAEQPTE